MSKICYLIFLFVFSFFSRVAFSDNGTHHHRWVFEKASSVDVLGNHDLNTISHLNDIYGKVTFTIVGKTLKIENDFLEDNKVCTVDYVKIKKTPISYYSSEKTVGLYARLFKHENTSLPKYFFVVTSLLPGYECPPPYNEFLEINDSLVIQDQGYVLFFKPIDTGGLSDRQSKDGWKNYCQIEKKDREYDGISKYSCFFPDLKLRQAYVEFIGFQYDNKFLEKEIPRENKVDKFNNSMVRYEWHESNSLRISVIRDSENVIFNFNELSTGTSLEVIEETQY